MPVFSYRALNQKGKTVRGVLDAESVARARQKLMADSLYPVKVTVSDSAKAKKKNSFDFKKLALMRSGAKKQIVPMTRQLATLLNAGLPLVQALDTIQEQAEQDDLGHVLATVKEKITGGEAFADALESTSGLFSSEYIHLVRAGEMSGSLGQVLTRLAQSMERSQARRAEVVTALAYPAFMTLVGAAVLFFVLAFLVPIMTGLFDDLGAALPWQTRLLLAISSFLQNFWWLLIILMAGLVFLHLKLMKRDEYMKKVESILFHIPYLGELMKKLYITQTMRSLSLLMAGGVSLTSSLEVTAKGLGRSGFADAVALARTRVSQGRSLAEGLSASSLFPPLVRRMVAAGEASGSLEEMLERLAQNYEDETQRVMTALTTLVEPLIILFMGLVIGFILLAVLLPIFELSGLVG